MNIVPLGDRVIVKECDQPEELAPGIFRPDTVRKDTDRGIVIAKGKGKILDSGERRRMEEFQVGDTVRFLKSSGTSIKIDGEEFLVMAEQYIVAVER